MNVGDTVKTPQGLARIVDRAITPLGYASFKIKIGMIGYRP